MSETVRDRLYDLESGYDRPRSRSESDAAFLGEVVDDGALSDEADRYCLVRPVFVDGEEVEGGPAAFTPDDSARVPVVVVGSAPVVGDRLACWSINGRWIAEKRIVRRVCNPTIQGCGGVRYAFVGEVEDARNGAVPFVYDHGTRRWATAPLKFSSIHTSANPNTQFCTLEHKFTFYQYSMDQNGVVRMLVKGGQCGTAANHKFAFNKSFFGTDWPGLPVEVEADSFDRASCRPFGGSASWSGSRLDGRIPSTAAAVRIPAAAETAHDWTCYTPCPWPEKDLTLSWVNVVDGDGSGTLAWDPAAREWAMPCVQRLTASVSGPPGVAPLVLFRHWPSESCGAGLAVVPDSRARTTTTCEPFICVTTVEPTPSIHHSPFYNAGYRTLTITE